MAEREQAVAADRSAGAMPAAAGDGRVPDVTPPHAAGHPRLWLGYLVAGALAVGAYYLLPRDWATVTIYQLIGLSSGAALIIGARLHRPARTLPWYLMGAGMLIWSVADAIGSWYGDGFPTPADPVYLLGYPVVAVGFWLLIRGRHQGTGTARALDSAILTTSLGVLSWVLLARPTIATYADSPRAAVIAISYPVANIVLAGLLIRLLTTPSGRTRSFGLLVVALVLLIAADTASSALRLLTFDSTRPIDFLWLTSYLAWGAAALDPSMVALSAPHAAARSTLARTQLALLTVAVLIAPVTLAVEAALALPLSVWAVVVGSVLTFVLVMIRMSLALVQVQAANADRCAAEAELSHQAAHDALTGLPNRTQAMRLIDGALSRAQRDGAVVGLLFVDLDGFKQVNDTLGHQAGDEVLTMAAERMRRTVRPGDVVARLGGDEFLVLLEPLDEQASGLGVAERVIAAVSDPMRLASGHEVRIGASVGLAISQDGDTDADRLLMEADLAVYLAKASGRGRTEVFDRTLREHLVRRTLVEKAVLAAVGSDEVTLDFDPVVELLTGEASHFEARTGCHIQGELLDREALIADLGRSPAVVELDAWCLRRTTAIVGGLGDQIGSVSVGVPVTAHHLVQDRVVTDVGRALSASGLAGERLVLTLPASEVSDDLRLLGNLTRLRTRGVRVCLDRFGAGAGPTNQWLQLPVAAVRLDPQLLHEAVTPVPGSTDTELGPEHLPGGVVEPGSSRPVQLLRLTVQTARAFGYRVIAPAIDDDTTLTAATRAGCQLGQGSVLTDLLLDQTVEYGPLMRTAGR